jgi:hypothetical protein
MMTVLAKCPVSIPVDVFILAIPGLEVDHAPPLIAFVMIMLLPIHTAAPVPAGAGAVPTLIRKVV